MTLGSIRLRSTHEEPLALWLADIGHVAITCYVMEYEKVVDIVNWNSMAWGNIGATVRKLLLHSSITADRSSQAVLFTFRTAYLLGLFGPDRLPATSKDKKSL